MYVKPLAVLFPAQRNAVFFLPIWHTNGTISVEWLRLLANVFCLLLLPNYPKKNATFIWRCSLRTGEFVREFEFLSAAHQKRSNDGDYINTVGFQVFSKTSRMLSIEVLHVFVWLSGELYSRLSRVVKPPMKRSWWSVTETMNLLTCVSYVTITKI